MPILLETVRSDDAARQLRRHGFAVVHDALMLQDISEVETLLDALFREFQEIVGRREPGRRRFAHDMTLGAPSANRPDQPEILYAASLDPRLAETSLFRKCSDFARAIIGGPASRCFDHAIVKAPWNESTTPWHQDAALTRFRAMPRLLQGRLHFWIPLQDATLENGCMEFIAGSHLRPLLPHRSYVRGNGDRAWAASPENSAVRVACPVAAGGFTIHLPGTLHYTGRNATARSRKAWVIHFSRFGRAEITLKRMFGRVPSAFTLAAG